ncbi:hypothetical protein ACWF94_31085 [Streptomyces sp. NPDC055078]
MAGLWSIDPGSSPYRVIRGTRGIQLNRCVADVGRTGLGGGLMRFGEDEEMGPWTLTYDEVFYVLAGELTITGPRTQVRLGPGEIGLIETGTTVTYRGTAGTEAFYSVTPRDWKPAGEALELEHGN